MHVLRLRSSSLAGNQLRTRQERNFVVSQSSPHRPIPVCHHYKMIGIGRYPMQQRRSRPKALGSRLRGNDAEQGVHVMDSAPAGERARRLYGLPPGWERPSRRAGASTVVFPKIHAGSAARALGPEILETLWAAATLTRGGANLKILRTNPLSAVESVADFDRPVI